MKILLTTHQFLPEFSAGTEILTFETAKEMQALGHDVAVFTGHPGRAALADNERFDSYSHAGLSVARFHYDIVPMGKQTNVVEAEYNNLLAASYFREYIKQFKPDLVHFFHLQRLSASIIDVCKDLRISMIMTPTDFWMVCPTNQLRLPDNSLCTGPDSSSINCLKHIVALTQSKLVAALVGNCPQRILALGVDAMSRGCMPNSQTPSLVRALFKRPGFMKERMNRLDKVVVPTRLMGQILQDNGLEKERIVFSPFGINLQYMEGVQKVERSEMLRIGFIGALAEHKGAHVLIEAMRLLPSEQKLDVKLYGKLDDFPDYVEKLKKSTDIDPRIKFCGTFPNHQIGEVFSNLDVLVVPSIWYENTPLVIYSAQAVGCPIIASNLGGMSEIIHHEDNGLLFKPGDASSLAATIERLIETPNLLENLTKNARNPKPVTEYVAELVDIYKEVLRYKRKTI